MAINADDKAEIERFLRHPEPEIDDGFNKVVVIPPEALDMIAEYLLIGVARLSTPKGERIRLPVSMREAPSVALWAIEMLITQTYPNALVVTEDRVK